MQAAPFAVPSTNIHPLSLTSCVPAGELRLQHQSHHQPESPATECVVFRHGSEEDLQSDGKRLVPALPPVEALPLPVPGGHRWKTTGLQDKEYRRHHTARSETSDPELSVTSVNTITAGTEHTDCTIPATVHYSTCNKPQCLSSGNKYLVFGAA